MNYEVTKPALYIVMFKDVPDMNPGKAVAQGAHAASKFTVGKMNDNYDEFFDLWLQEGDGFGTKYTVMDTTDGFDYLLELMEDDLRYDTDTGLIKDMTYPCKNWYGETFIMEGVLTCGWVFVTPETDESVVEYLKSLSLMP